MLATIWYLQDMAYHVPSNSAKGERAYLLKGINGWFDKHQMSALMGPSGSGKTVSSMVELFM